MLKPIYIVLSLLNIGFGTLASLMIISFFGATASADAYLIALAIVSTLQLIQLLMVDQFLHFYLEKKRISFQQAKYFFSTVFAQSAVMGLLFAICGLIFYKMIILLFAAGLEPERQEKLADVFGVLVWSCVFYPANFVSHKLLNAESRFVYPYWLEMIAPLSCLLMFGYFILGGAPSLILIAYARVGGLGLSFFMACLTLARLGCFTKIKIFSREGFSCYKNSFSMRFGHNLHNFLFGPITTNLLSTLPVGSAAIYYYSERLAQLLSSVIAGPIQRVYQVRISIAWLDENMQTIYLGMKRYFGLVLTLFISGAVALYLLIPAIFTYFLSASLDSMEIELIQSLFIVIAGWIGIIAVEHTFVAVGLAAKESMIFIKVNIMFIIGYFVLCYFLKDFYGIFAIPVSAIISQVISFGIFAVFIMSLIKRRL